MLASINDLQDHEFEARVLKAEQPVLLEFWAPWCGPCRKFAPVLGEVLDDFKDRLRLLRVNTDECIDVPQRCDISSIPTLILYSNGEEIVRFVGKKSDAELRAGLQRAFAEQ